MPSLDEIGPVILEKMKMWTTTTIDNGQSAIRKAFFSFGSGELQRVCNLVFKTRCHFLWCPTMQLSVIFYTLLNGIFTCLYRCLYRGFILTIFFLIVSHFLLCIISSTLLNGIFTCFHARTFFSYKFMKIFP